MNQNEQTIEKLYSGFADKNFAQMAECYHDNATFKDEAFDLKNGKEISAMWRMLISRGKDLSITFNNIKADEKRGSANWEAFYTFSKTGRKVHNIIEANFEFENGKIIKHIDKFDFWKWSKESLGIVGSLLGWSGFLRSKVSKTAMQSLADFIKENP
jgi:hypothetical protein